MHSLAEHAPFFEIYVSPPLFSVPPTFKVFQTVTPTLTQPPPALIRHTNKGQNNARSSNMAKCICHFMSNFPNSKLWSFCEQKIENYLKPF